MHSPQCPGYAGGLRTLLVPRRADAPIEIGEGSQEVSAGLPVRRGLSLVVTSSAGCTVALPYAGGDARALLFLDAGAWRIVAAEDHADVLISTPADGSASVYLEDLATFAARQPRL